MPYRLVRRKERQEPAVLSRLTLKPVFLLQLVLGVPFYGRGGTALPSFVDYKDVKADGEFVEMWDEKAQAPYLADKDGNLVLGYDTPKSLSLKCAFIKDNGLLGGMYWEYAGDNDAAELQRVLATEHL